MLADEQQMTDAGVEFQLFLAYAMEKMDVYGRLLAFLDRNQPNAASPGPRPPTYNQRMLAGGFARPYFIWPNIDPFRQHTDLLSAVPTPDGFPGWVANAPSTERYGPAAEESSGARCKIRVGRSWSR
jgi:hypothetical protein